MRLLLASNIKQSIDKIDNILQSQNAGKEILCIPTATYAEDDYSWLRPNNIDVFTERGYNLTEYDIREKTEEEVRNVIEKHKVIFITGGNTFYLLQYIKSCNLKSILNEFFDRGGIYIGSSTGSIVMGKDIEFISKMDEPEKAILDNYNSLGFIDINFVPHNNSEEHGKEVQRIIDNPANKNKPLLCLENSQMLYVQNNKIEIL